MQSIIHVARISCPIPLRLRLCLLFLAALLLDGVVGSAAPAPDLTVPIPPGETALATIGLYRIWWQSYGKEPVAMPLSWTGHFDEATGISFQAAGRVLDREALLIHSPWHVAPGKTWVDYELALPKLKPIRLCFGIAMRPDVAVPGKSDGVTFSCRIRADGQEHELMRQHQDKGAWLDYSLDLSPYAGKTVTLSLQVEPGPKNDPSFDYSLFGEARIEAGEAKPKRAALLKHLTTARAYRVLEAATRAEAGTKHGHQAMTTGSKGSSALLNLCNSPTNGVAPSNLLPHKNSLTKSGRTWQFSYAGPDCRVVYQYEPLTGTLDDFTAQVDNTRPFRLALSSGATDVVASGTSTHQCPLSGGRPLTISRAANTLRVSWEYPLTNGPVRLDWEFTIVGKALVVSAQCDQPSISSFSLGEVGAPFSKPFNVPYLLGQVHYLPAQNAFICRYLDWTASHASSCPQGTATYEQKTDGTRNPLFEKGYIAVSPDIAEVLPNIPHPPSPFIATLGPNIMLDIWGHHRGTYAGDAEKLRELKDNGVDHLVIIQHDWQRFGYDVKLPDHVPANPRYGSEADLAAFGQAARDAGYLWSLHENYIDLYPDAPSYDATARVLNADGTPTKAWYNAGTQVQSYGLKCNRALGYAQQNSPEAHRRYGTTAAYLDVHTCVPPWHQLEHEAGQPLAAMTAAKVKNDTALFQYERDTHRGSLFGEGANHFYWAGRCDGVEAQVAGGEDHAPFLDFDLLKLHPQMVNHGLGYYERWFRRGYDAQWGADAGSLEQLDKYRAMELAYGHAGFLGANLVHHVPSVVREHNLMHAVQRLYGTARPVEIRYEVEGQFLTASAALVAGDTARQRIRYDSGLTIWINWRPEPWKIDPKSARRSSNKASWQSAAEHNGPGGSAVELPQWGFLAVGPDTEASTALHGDHIIADYAVCPEYVFADARTCVDQPWVRPRKNIEPRLRTFEHLGSGRIRLTYEWRVNDTLDTDYNCFVHFINPAHPAGEQIVFQQDHALPKPTSQWRKGEVIVDGPYELQVPSQYTSYNLTIGLFKAERVRLQGLEDNPTRILLSHLKLEKNGAEITGVTAEPATAGLLAHSPVAEADFAARHNPPGTWIDFGPVATDGSVKISRQKDSLVLFPYPRENRFRLSLNLAALAAGPTTDLSRLQVRAQAAATQEDLGPEPFQVQAGKLILEVGRPKAGRFLVKW
jgi:hypothetical protein